MSEPTIKTPEEIQKLREGGRILARILKEVARATRPGIRKKDLDNLARELIGKYQVEASFLDFGEPPYPAAICVSSNEEIVHCIPGEAIIKEGDIVGLDLGIWHRGLCTDMAVTVPVGKITPIAKKLVKVTRRALEIAIKQVAPGKTTGDLGAAVQRYVESQGFSVVRKLVGHGVGYKVHEPPQIPNFGTPGLGETFKPGMVVAIEPMVNVGHHDIYVKSNKWDIVTKDGSLSAHFEKTVAVTQRGCEILT